MTNPFGQHLRDPERVDRNNPFGRGRGRERPDASAAFFSGAADAASFGFGDELKGLVFGREEMEAARRRQEEYRLYNPLAYGAGQLTGTLAGGFPLAAGARAAITAGRGLGWLGRAGVWAGAGGLGAGAYGAGTVASDDAGARFQAGMENFVPGAVVGGGFSLAGSALGPAVSRAWRGANPERAAADLLARGLQREGLDEAALSQRLGEHVAMGRGGTLLDAMGESGEQLAMGAAARPSAGRTAMRGMLEGRGAQMGPRAQQEIAREFGGGDVGDDLIRLEARRAADSQPHYAAAYAQTVAPQQAAGMRQMVALDARLAPDDQILTRATQAARSAHIQRTGNPNVSQAELEASPRYWHDVLEEAQGMLGLQLRAARTGAMGGLTGSSAARATERMGRFNRLVRGALGDDFRRAQDIYAGASRTMRAQELGYDLVGPNFNSLRVGEAMREIRRMSQGEIEQLRVAASARLRDMIANADPMTGRADVLRAISRSAGQRQLFERIFGAGRLNDLMRRFEYDRRLFQTGVNTGIRTNSHTAPILSAEAAQREATMTPATTPGGIFERLFGPELRRAADARSEDVSTALLRMLATPADEALTGIRGGGVRQFGERRGLLALAAKRRQQLADFRRNATVNAFAAGPYVGIGGDTLLAHLGAD